MTKEIDEWLRRKAKEAADKWFEEQCKNPYEHFYLYYKEGEITITDAPLELYDEDFELAAPQRISPSWTKPQFERFIIETMKKLPCLPKELWH